jgi:hypothetical protein
MTIKGKPFIVNNISIENKKTLVSEAFEKYLERE